LANSFKNAVSVVTTTVSVLYTSTGESILHGIFLANIIGTQVTGTVIFYDASSTTEYYILFNSPILPGSTLVFDKPINLETGDQIRLVASDADSISAFTSILEIG
jgi:hypothetical protein